MMDRSADTQDTQSAPGPASPRRWLTALRTGHRWLPGVAAVLGVLVASLLIWGPGMEFPTTISQSEEPAGDGRTVTLDKTVREVTGDSIDDAVSWLTEEGDWLFDSLSDATAYVLVYIEDALKWIPWPVLIVGLALLSFVVGRWRLLGFTALALLYIGFMGLWQNAIDTTALIVVAVAVALAIGLPLGVLGARNHIADSLMRPILDAMQTMPSFVYLLPGILFLRPRQAGRHLRDRHLRGAPRHPPHQSRYPPGLPRGRRGRLGVRIVAPAGADEGPNPDGLAHDHGRHQPDHADGAGDGDHCQYGGRRRLG